MIMRYSAADWHILRQLTVSQFKLKDQSSFFGFLWSFLHPVLMLAVLYAFFSFGPGSDIDHYAIYLLLGLVLYTHFANSTSLGMRVLRSMRELTTDAVFPKELLVFSALFCTSVELFLSVGICLVLALITGVGLTPMLLWLPVILLAALLLVTWVSLLLATVFPFAWDVEHIYHVVLRVLFFVTPIFYAEDFLGDGVARRVVAFNPLAYVVGALRDVVIDGVSPSPWQLGAFLLLNAVLLLVTLSLFRRSEPRFAEYV